MCIHCTIYTAWPAFYTVWINGRHKGIGQDRCAQSGFETFFLRRALFPLLQCDSLSMFPRFATNGDEASYWGPVSAPWASDESFRTFYRKLEQSLLTFVCLDYAMDLLSRHEYRA